MRYKKSEAISHGKRHGNGESYHSNMKLLSSLSKPILCLTITVVVLSQTVTVWHIYAGLSSTYTNHSLQLN